VRQVGRAQPAANFFGRVGDPLGFHAFGRTARKGGDAGHQQNGHFVRVAVGGRDPAGGKAALAPSNQTKMHRQRVLAQVEALIQR